MAAFVTFTELVGRFINKGMSPALAEVMADVVINNDVEAYIAERVGLYAMENWGGAVVVKNESFFHRLSAIVSGAAWSLAFFGADLSVVSETGYAPVDSSGNLDSNKIAAIRGVALRLFVTALTLSAANMSAAMSFLRLPYIDGYCGSRRLRLDCAEIPGGPADARFSQSDVDIPASAGTPAYASTFSNGQGWKKLSPQAYLLPKEKLKMQLTSTTTATLSLGTATLALDVVTFSRPGGE
jgi:hypothetical protein